MTALLVGLLLLLGCLLSWWFRRRETYWKRRGVVQVPFLEWVKYTAMQYYQPTHIVWDEIHKKYGPVVGTFTADTPTLMVADPEMLKEIMIKNFASFPNTQFIQRTGDPVLDNTLVALVDDEWRVTRSAVAPTFSTAKMKQMIPIIKECAAETVKHLVAAARAGGPYDIKPIFSAFTLDVIARTNYRIKMDSYDNADDPFVRHASCFFDSRFKWRAFLCLQFPRFSKLLGLRIFSPKAVQFFNDLVLRVFRERASRPGVHTGRPDFINLLMNAEPRQEDNAAAAASGSPSKKKCTMFFLLRNLDRKPIIFLIRLFLAAMSKQMALAQAVLFFVAGVDTSSNALAMTCYYLALNPDVQKRLAEEVCEALEAHEEITYDVLMGLEYLDAVVKETLRISAPVVMTYRTCSRSTIVAGITVEKGSFIRIPIYSLHRNEQYFVDPEVFRPERFLGENHDRLVPFSFIPFGEGPRQCIGMKFALLEYKLCLFKVVARVGFQVCLRTRIPPKCHPSILVMVPDDMVLRVFERKPQASDQ